ncbi:DUF1294 domain-containing protein [Flavobacterium degerlachei]|jgi:uncharacterized membrane protein YsdA (DUF1294 family)|nr:DUF1294 domain-containing protein [Flavobacterium degerlachei]
MYILFYFIIILNCISFLVTAYDKRLAIKNKRRISEKTLLSFVAFGGTIGAGIAMFFFRHKTAKASFLWKYFGLVLLQIVFIYLLFYKELITF